MKFLVLALCVCAASAASFGNFQNYQPFKTYSSGPSQASSQAYVSNNGPTYSAFKNFGSNAPVAQSSAKVVGSYNPVVKAVQAAAVPASAPFVQAANAVASAEYTPVAAAKTVSGYSSYTGSQDFTPVTAAKAVAYAPVAAVQAVKNYANKEGQAQVLRSDSTVSSDGFNYYYETDNGIAVQSEGFLKKVGNEEGLAQQGSIRYPLANGETFTLTYTADENGYQPKSDFLPVSPPIPEAIRRSLEYINARTVYNNAEKKY